MVYNKYSYMRWRRNPLATLREAIRGLRGSAKPTSLTSETRRGDYDVNAEGQAAPETALRSVGELKTMLRRFEAVTCTKQNANPFVVKGLTLIPRFLLLPTMGRLAGLDIYVEARKAGMAATQAAAA
jgi:hypothetical protein